MKKMLLGFAAAATLFTACKSDKAIDLKFRLPQGEVVYYTSDMKQTINQTVMGNAMTVQQDMLFRMAYKVLSVEGTNRTVEIAYDRIKMETDAMGQKIKFDSQDSTGNNPQLAMLSGLVGKPFQMTVSEAGKVLSVSGFDAVLNGMTGDPTDPRAAAARQQLDQMFSDEAVKEMLSQSTDIYPEQMVKPGDTWTRTHTTSMGPISMEVANTYKLESATDKTANVSVNATITGKSTNSPAGIQGMTVDMKGKQSGKMEIEIATGVLQKMDLTQDIEGTMGVQGMKVPMTIKTVGTITGSKNR